MGHEEWEPPGHPRADALPVPAHHLQTSETSPPSSKDQAPKRCWKMLEDVGRGHFFDWVFSVFLGSLEAEPVKTSGS